MKEIIAVIAENNILEGCTVEQIEIISRIANFQLPQTYIQFLKAMGNHACFLAGESYSFEDIPLLKKDANFTFKNGGGPSELTELDFVFSTMQGITFWYFRLDEGDNPPVYCYMEGVGQKMPKMIATSFSNYIKRKSENDPSLFDGIR